MKNQDLIILSGMGLLFGGIGYFGFRIYTNQRDASAASFMDELDRAIQPGAEAAQTFSYECNGLSNSKRLTVLQQQRVCETINDAFGVLPINDTVTWLSGPLGYFLNHDEEAIYEALRNLKSREQFCQVNTKYREMYDRALQDEMEERLSKEEFQKVMNIINAKPVYVT